jgi:hypothetical protein
VNAAEPIPAPAAICEVATIADEGASHDGVVPWTVTVARALSMVQVPLEARTQYVAVEAGDTVIEAAFDPTGVLSPRNY